MKKTLLLLFVLSLCSFNSVETENSIIGKWKGEDKGDIGFVTFDAQGYALFEIGDQKMGGKEFTMKGKKGKMTYHLNRETKPMELDLTITIIETNEVNTLLGIINFESQDKIRLAIGFDGSIRPTEFDEENSIYFRRERE